jgi:hypothetical protein
MDVMWVAIALFLVHVVQVLLDAIKGQEELRGAEWANGPLPVTVRKRNPAFVLVAPPPPASPVPVLFVSFFSYT